MREKKALERLRPLLQTSGFTSREARKLGVSSSTLAYYVKQKELIRIGHGVYRGINDPVGDDFRFEDLIEAMLKVRNGVICLRSALSLYNLTDEMPSQHWIAIRNKTLHRGNTSIKVIRMRNLTLGITKIKIGNVMLPIFDRERTIVDAFRYLGRETALKALKTALKRKGDEKINVTKIRQYAKELRINIEPFLLAMTL
jgi:predicted transcriptional regulator of viral defense system